MNNAVNMDPGSVGRCVEFQCKRTWQAITGPLYLPPASEALKLQRQHFTVTHSHSKTVNFPGTASTKCVWMACSQSF